MDMRIARAENLDRLHILLVDQNPVTLEKKALLLEGCGCLVTCSTTCIEANSLIKEYPGVFDVIMADCSVPGINGIESAISAADTPIILYIGNNVSIDEKLMADMPFKILN